MAGLGPASLVEPDVWDKTGIGLFGGFAGPAVLAGLAGSVGPGTTGSLAKAILAGNRFGGECGIGTV